MIWTGETYQLELSHRLKHLVRQKLQEPCLWTQDAQRLLYICKKKSGTLVMAPHHKVNISKRIQQNKWFRKLSHFA